MTTHSLATGGSVSVPMMPVAKAVADMAVMGSLFVENSRLERRLERHEAVARGLADILDPLSMPEEVLLSAWVLIKWCRVQVSVASGRADDGVAVAKQRIEAASNG